jgi:hypothetical protein
MNKIMFAIGVAIGVAIIIIAALMMFCQERCFLGVDLESWPAVLGIIGICIMTGTMGASQFIPMKQKKKR